MSENKVNHPLLSKSEINAPLNFQSIYSHFLSIKKDDSQGIGNAAKHKVDLKLAMKEAEGSYDSMMKIREQLSFAYKEVMKCNNSQ